MESYVAGPGCAQNVRTGLRCVLRVQPEAKSSVPNEEGSATDSGCQTPNTGGSHDHHGHPSAVEQGNWYTAHQAHTNVATDVCTNL